MNATSRINKISLDWKQKLQETTSIAVLSRDDNTFERMIDSPILGIRNQLVFTSRCKLTLLPLQHL